MVSNKDFMRKILFLLLFIYSINTLFAQTFTGSSGSSIGAIPDNSSKCFPLTVSGLAAPLDGNYGLASVTINIAHTYDAELIIKLQAPDGTEITLTNQNGSSGNNYTGTTFTSTATKSINAGTAPFTGTFLPQGSLGAFNTNINGNGDWKLCVTDNMDLETGSVKSWSLTFNNTPAIAPPPIPACTSTGLATNFCKDAPMVCNFDGLCGNTSAAFTAYKWPELESAFCGRIDNNSFIKFIASSTSASFNVWVYNSKTGDGIQTFFFDGGCGSGAVTGYGCTYILLPSAYPNVVQANNLKIGNTYYLMIDGAAGDVCDYTVKPISGVNVINVNVNPATKNICQGTDVNLSASGGLGQTYTWASTNAAASLPTPATGATIAVNSSILTTGSYDYTVTGESIGGCPATKTVTLNIVATPVISLQPTPALQTLSINTPASTLSVASTTLGVTYQWYKNTANSTTGGVAIVGANSTTYTPSTKVASNYFYYCAVSNGGCVTTSNVVNVIVNALPGCTAYDAFAFEKQPTTTEQSVAMTPVTVKIYCSLTGSIATSYPGKVTLTAKDGCGYVAQTVDAVNGIATFSNIIFTRSVQHGVSLIATATGIAGSVTSDTFSINAPTGGGTTTKRITIASNDFESPLTGKWSWAAGTATFPIDDVTGIACNQGNCYIRKSDKGKYSSGTSENKNTVTFANFTNLSKYKNLKFSFKVASLSDVGCATTPNTGTCKSADVNGTVYAAGTDNNEDIKVETSIDGGVTWQTLLTHQGSSNRLFPFATTPVTTLALGASATYSAGQDLSSFTVDITGNNQFMFKFTATDNRFSENWCMDDILLEGDETINTSTQSPLPTVVASGDASICSGTNTAISSVVSNATLPISSYSWSTAANLVDATVANPTTVTTLNEGQAYNFSVIVTDADNCTATSNPVTVNILRLPTLLSQSTNGEVGCEGGTFKQMSVTALHTENYQWYYNSSASNSGGILIPGAVSSTFTPSKAIAGTGTFYYYCVMGGACNPSVTSAVSGAVTINALPSITTHPSTVGQTVCTGTSFITPLSVTATGDGLSYHWFSNIANSISGGTAITGATSSSYLPSSVTSGKSYYYCVVSGTCTPSVTSNVSGLFTVNPIPQLSSTLTLSAICSETNFSYTATSSIAGATFSWTRATVVGISQTGTTGTGNISEQLTNTTSSPIVVTYIYTTTANTCSGAAQNVTVTVDPLPTASVSGTTSTTICSYGTAIVPTLSATSANGTILWTDNGSGVLTDANTLTPSYTPAAVDAGKTITLTLTVSGINACATKSDIATFKVNVDSKVVPLVLTGTKICADATVGSLTSSTSVTGISYQLFNSSKTAVGSPINGTGTSLNWSTVPSGTGYYAVASNADNCTAQSNAVDVTLLAVPFATITTNTPAICNGNDAVFSISGNPNATVTYNINNGVNTTINLDATGSKAITITKPIITQTVNLVSILNNTTNCTKTLTGVGTSATVTVNTLPTLTTQAITPDCNASSVDLRKGVTSNTTGLDVKYYLDAGLTKLNTGNFITTVGTYYVKVSNTTTFCTTSASIVVNPYPQNPVLTTQGVTPACDVTSVDLSTTITSSKTQVNLKYFSDRGLTNQIPQVVSTSGTYYIEAKDKVNGCATTQSVVISAFKTTPSLTAQTITPACGVSSIDLLTGISPTSGLNFTFFKDAGLSQVAANPVNASGTFYVKGTNADGCSGSVAIKVNALKPNPTIVA